MGLHALLSYRQCVRCRPGGAPSYLPILCFRVHMVYDAEASLGEWRCGFCHPQAWDQPVRQSGAGRGAMARRPTKPPRRGTTPNDNSCTMDASIEPSPGQSEFLALRPAPPRRRRSLAGKRFQPMVHSPGYGSMVGRCHRHLESSASNRPRRFVTRAYITEHTLRGCSANGGQAHGT